jgi:hypothetical protein
VPFLAAQRLLEPFRSGEVFQIEVGAGWSADRPRIPATQARYIYLACVPALSRGGAYKGEGHRYIYLCPSSIIPDSLSDGTRYIYLVPSLKYR